MANQIPLTNILDPSAVADQIQLDRRMRMADMLRQQALAPDQQQTAGGYVLPYSPLQGAAKMLQAYTANKLESETDKQRKEMQQAKMQKISEALKGYGKVTETTQPDMSRLMTASPDGSMPQTFDIKSRPATPEEQMQQDWQLTQLDPSFAKILEARHTREQTQQDKLEQIRLQRELAAQQLKASQQPYYQFFPTASGFAVGNARTGQMQSAQTDAQGRPIVPGQFDVQLQGKLAGSKAAGGETGKGYGEAEAKLSDIQSMMPRLQSLTQELSDLGKKATYTYTGQAIDTARRQAGMEPTEGAVARKEYISKVDNEILPLLRQTFGAQFTEREGSSLRATLGDPNASPAEKDAVLRSFIQTKTEQVKSLQRRTGAGIPPSAPSGGAVNNTDLHSRADAILRGM